MQAAGQNSDRPELRIEQLERRLRELDTEDDRVRSGFRVGILDVEQAKVEFGRSEQARSIVRSELAEIMDRLQQNKRTADLRVTLDGFRERVLNDTPEQQAAILREIVERITVTGDHTCATAVMPSWTGGTVRRWSGSGGNPNLVPVIATRLVCTRAPVDEHVSTADRDLAVGPEKEPNGVGSHA